MAKGTGEISRAISLSPERQLKWLVMLKSTLSGSFQEGKIREEPASMT